MNHANITYLSQFSDSGDRFIQYENTDEIAAYISKHDVPVELLPLSSRDS